MVEIELGQWLKRVGISEPASHRLICFGHAGATCATFNNWKASLDTAVEVIGVSLPGRGERINEAPRSDLRAMAREIADEVSGLPPMPTIFFGHSIGAIFAYEVAQEITAGHQNTPCSVVVSASGTSTRTPLDDVSEHNQAEILESLVKCGYLSTDQLGNDRFVELILPYLTADILCKKHWQQEGRPRLRAPIHGFSWADDEFLEPSAMYSWRSKSEFPDLCESFLFSGGHLEYLCQPPDMFIALNYLFSKQIASEQFPLRTRGHYA